MKMRSKRGFTLIELMFTVGIIGVLSAIAAPALSRTKLAANESSAIGSLRAIYSGQLAFSVGCGSGHFAMSLEDLSARVGASPGFVGPDIGATGVVKSGYELDLGSDSDAVLGLSCHPGTAVALSYHATADPKTGQGTRYFGTNSGGGLFQASEFLAMPDLGVPPAPWVPINSGK